MEKNIVEGVGNELDKYIKLFDDLRRFYDDPSNESIKDLFCIKLDLYFHRIKVYDKTLNIYDQLTDCDYMKSK